MFVQTAQRGSFGPKPGEPGVYELTLENTSAQTIYFSDRPDRIVGTVPTDTFLEALGFTPADPPNAALVAQTDNGEGILVVELLNPRWDMDQGTLTYDVRVLNDYQGDGLGHLVERQVDTELAETFEHASLFIDDCADVTTCYGTWGRTVVGPFPEGTLGRCWGWWPFGCNPCDGRSIEAYNEICNQTYPACDGQCTIAPDVEPVV